MTKKPIALVTGANKGIGFETCRQLAGKGMRVILSARDENKGRAAAERLAGEGLDVTFLKLDISDFQNIAAAKRQLEDQYDRLDVLVNNAGMVRPEEDLFGSSVATISREALLATFEVNFFGAVALTQALLPLLEKSKAGRIVNVSSMLGSLGLHANPDSGLDQIKPFAYDASKSALNQFTIHLAAALKDTPIKVNSAHPGWVKTDLGTDQAPMEVVDGARTSVELATLGPDGPTGGFFHLGESMPW